MVSMEKDSVLMCYLFIFYLNIYVLFAHLSRRGAVALDTDASMLGECIARVCFLAGPFAGPSAPAHPQTHALN